MHCRLSTPNIYDGRYYTRRSPTTHIIDAASFVLFTHLIHSIRSLRELP